jgi:glutamine synthetase
VPCASLKTRLADIAGAVEEAAQIAVKLDAARIKAKGVSDALEQAEASRDAVFVAMEELRAPVDRLEKLMPKDLWPMPSYDDLLFRL